MNPGSVIPALSALALAVLGGGAWLLLSSGDPAAPSDGASGAAGESEHLAQGRALYALHCAACHGADLEGQPDWQSLLPDGRLPAPPHDETGHTWHHGDGMLTAYVRDGGQAVLDALGVDMRSGMPAFAELLAPAEIAAILGFIRSTWSEPVRAFQAGRTQDESRAGGN